MVNTASVTFTDDADIRVLPDRKLLPPFVGEVAGGRNVKFFELPHVQIAAMQVNDEEPCIALSIFDDQCDDCPNGHGVLYRIALADAARFSAAIERAVAEIAAHVAKGAN